MKNKLSKIFLLLFLLGIISTGIVSCSDDESLSPPTIEEVEASIIGQWKSDMMVLTFKPNGKVRITHREIEYDNFYSVPRDEEEAYYVTMNNDKVCIHIGYDNYGYEIDEYDEYMYIHQLSNNYLYIEFYGKDIFFKLYKNKDVLPCYICNGTGSWDKNCSLCGGTGGSSEISSCYYCSGAGSWDCFYCEDGYTYNEDGEQEVCDWCRGQGWENCAACLGTGEETYYDPCDRCIGGKITTECYYCHGEGFVIE